MTRAVAYNMVGPTLPQALRAVRYPLYDPGGNFRETDKDDPDTISTTCPEEHGAGVITSEEKRKLVENSEVVNTLEDIFGLTCVASPYPCHNLCFLLFYIQAERPDLTQKYPYAGRILALPKVSAPNLVVHQHISG
jgi:hypothetical protein